MSAFLDAISTRIQRRPRVMQLGFGLARRGSPILVLGRNVVVLGADEVREALARSHDFELGPIGARKMLMGPFLLGMDPRRQYTLEREWLADLLQGLQGALEKVTTEVCAEAFSRLEGRRSIEVVSEFAQPVVTRVASRFFGVRAPQDCRSNVLAARDGEELLAQWLRKVGSVIATTSPAPFGLQRVATDCAAELQAHLQREIGREPPPDTVLARLLERVNSEEIRLERVLPNLAGLMLAGSTALVKSFAHALQQILKRPETIAAALAAPSVEPFVLEALRFNPTFPVVMRFCPRATRLGEDRHAREIPAGAKLYVVLLAAMFDDRVGDADEFAPSRPADHHLHFGGGTHECLGGQVARTILAEMFRVFLALPGLRHARGSRIRYDGPAVDRFRLTRIAP
jgi:cytochrome P450